MNFNIITKPKIVENTEGPKDLDLKEPNASKFRLQLKKGKLILTYKTHLDKTKYTNWLLNKGKKCSVWVAHENADQNNPYAHSHVLIMYEVAMQTTNARYFDYENIHPNIKKIITKQHLLNVLKYMCKEDKRLTIPMQRLAEMNEMTLFEQVSKCETIQEVMNMAQTPGDALGLAKMFSLKKRRPIKVLPPYYTWQKDLNGELKLVPHDRKIIWYCDILGDSGKTKMAKYLAVTYPQDVYIVSQFGGATNAASIVKSALDGGWTGQAMIVNLTRSAETKSIYEPLEMIKDGLITATKYQGETLVFPEPHLIVFANFLPDVLAMSLDRWEIRMMNKVDGVPRVTEIISGAEALKRLDNEEMDGIHDDSFDPPASKNMDKLNYSCSSNGDNGKWK